MRLPANTPNNIRRKRCRARDALTSCSIVRALIECLISGAPRNSTCNGLTRARGGVLVRTAMDINDEKKRNNRGGTCENG